MEIREIIHRLGQIKGTLMRKDSDSALHLTESLMEDLGLEVAGGETPSPKWITRETFSALVARVDALERLNEISRMADERLLRTL